MKTCRLILLLVMALFITAFSKAQSTMDVSKFTRLDNDLTARITKPVRDNDEGKLCALIRVITNLKDIEFRADALGISKDGAAQWRGVDLCALWRQKSVFRS